MRSFERPSKPHNFDRAVSKAAADLVNAITTGQEPDFVDTWKDFKQALHTAQKGLCGYCEGIVAGLHYGDLEHFRPKAEVRELHRDPALWGREVHGKSSVSNRTMQPGTLKPGYWWLAYDWDNYLFSCAVCNQQWKKNLFPVTGARNRSQGENSETGLLLSPFEPFEPAEHFIYGRLGEIKGRSPRGCATIATCGLDRPSLRLQRQRIAAATHAQLDKIAAGITNAALLELLLQLRDDGRSGRPFSGMVQAIFGQRSGYRWSHIQALIDALDADLKRDASSCAQALVPMGDRCL